MDTDRLAEFLSTVVIVGMIGLLAARTVGISSVQEQLLTGASTAVVFGVPFAFLLVYVFDVGSSHVGPYEPEDVVFLAAVAPPVALTVWLVDAAGLTGVLYVGAILIGVFASIVLAVVVRDLTVGEWPPGSGVPRDRDAGPPSQ